MKKNIYQYLLAALLLLGSAATAMAGNPDRQGEAGAYELLLNPWARSSGLHSMTTSCVRGAEAMFLNVAGIGRASTYGADSTTFTDIAMGHARLYEGSGISLSSFSIAQKLKSGGAIGLSISAVDFGAINVTTTNQPEGTGATYSPTFFNIALGYSQTFVNKISVGFLFKGIVESTSDVSATGFALDAGVQYVTGDKDEFKFGISLKNIGSKMSFGGQGLSQSRKNPAGNYGYNLTYDTRGASFELPSQLNIGASYDFLLNSSNRLTAVGNFTSNAFSRDIIGGGVEYGFGNYLALRAGYRYELGFDKGSASLYTGVSAGVSVDIPIKKDTDNRVGIDYAYLPTNPFNGTHQLTVRIGL